MAEKQFPSERKGLYFVGFALLCCLALFVNPILTPRSPVPRDHIDLSDVAVFSLEKISFCLLVVLLSAVGVWGLWKLVQRDVSAWAALDFQQSLALVLLAGLLSTIVLKVVSGAREFAMSEAWKNRGIGEPLERATPDFD